jgi:hypothetical protein
VYAAQIFIHSFNETREREKRQLLAAKLENEQDIVAEFLFQESSATHPQRQESAALTHHVAEHCDELAESH